MDSSKPILGKITKKSDYLKMKTGLRFVTPGFIIQGRSRKKESNFDPYQIRYGLTCSKRVGNSVKRNRAKRRLRALVKKIIPIEGLKGWDYVLIGIEKTTEEISFKILETNLKDALSKLHKMELKKIEKN